MGAAHRIQAPSAVCCPSPLNHILSYRFTQTMLASSAFKRVSVRRLAAGALAVRAPSSAIRQSPSLTSQRLARPAPVMASSFSTSAASGFSMPSKSPEAAYDPEITDIASYIHNYKIDSDLALDTSRYILLDTIGCGLEALRFPQCSALLGPTVEGTTVPNGARVPGTPFVLDPVNGAFNIGAMIRWLDYNDCWLAAEWGHPSDNLGAILAVADWIARTNRVGGKLGNGKIPTVRDVLEGMIKAHEIQGCLALENSFNRVGLDHVLFLKLASMDRLYEPTGILRTPCPVSLGLLVMLARGQSTWPSRSRMVNQVFPRFSLLLSGASTTSYSRARSSSSNVLMAPMSWKMFCSRCHTLLSSTLKLPWRRHKRSTRSSQIWANRPRTSRKLLTALTRPASVSSTSNSSLWTTLLTETTVFSIWLQQCCASTVWRLRLTSTVARLLPRLWSRTSGRRSSVLRILNSPRITMTPL